MDREVEFVSAGETLRQFSKPNSPHISYVTLDMLLTLPSLLFPHLSPRDIPATS